MNRKLNNDWFKKQGLFNSAILYCETEYSQKEQLKILQIIWEYLKSKFQSTETLFFLNDWHAHDGYISKEVANETETFMLRWYCNIEENNEVYCDFTLVLSSLNELKRVEKMIRKGVINTGLKIEKAEQYFEERYAG